MTPPHAFQVGPARLEIDEDRMTGLMLHLTPDEHDARALARLLLHAPGLLARLVAHADEVGEELECCAKLTDEARALLGGT